MSTAEKIRLPDDCTIGYIIESVLGVKLIRSNLFHSHLENLHQVPKTEIHKQVNLTSSKKHLCKGQGRPTYFWCADPGALAMITSGPGAWGFLFSPTPP